MRYLGFAALLVFSISSWSQNRIQFKKGSSILIPASLFRNVSLLENTSSHAVLEGRTDGTFFLFVSQPGAIGDKDPFQVLYDRLEMEPFELESIADPAGKRDLPLFRVESEGPYRNFLMGAKTVSNNSTDVRFILMGPEEGFYTNSPDFWRMASSYRPRPAFEQARNQVIEPQMVVLALLVLGLNTIIIWLGLRKFGNFRLEGN